MTNDTRLVTGLSGCLLLAAVRPRRLPRASSRARPRRAGRATSRVGRRRFRAGSPVVPGRPPSASWWPSSTRTATSASTPPSGRPRASRWRPTRHPDRCRIRWTRTRIRRTWPRLDGPGGRGPDSADRAGAAAGPEAAASSQGRPERVSRRPTCLRMPESPSTTWRRCERSSSSSRTPTGSRSWRRSTTPTSKCRRR